MIPRKPRKRLIGVRFLRLVVIGYAGRDKWNSHQWNCLCDCGNTKVIKQSGLLSETTRSCGCLKTEESSKRLKTHGYCGTSTYKTWVRMIQRCTDPKHIKYTDYGGRGITVCNRWLKFENFLNDMGERPPNLEIDRIENDGNYEPDNCQWVTRAVNCSNKRNTIHIIYKGELKTLPELIKITGIPETTLRRKLALNCSIGSL
jgi:hypothetical protein